jgi:transcription elongation GreA/GreB family factor
VDLGASRTLGEISMGAMIELQHNKQQRLYFLIPTAGGTMLKVQDETVLVVSVFSPIGDALMGLKVGEEFEVETPKETRHYQVVSFQ